MFTTSFPRTRADCVGKMRPCPWIRCEFHPYLIINNFFEPRRSQASRYYGLEPWQLPHTCILDVIDSIDPETLHDGKMKLKAIGEVLGYNRESIRLFEKSAFARLTPSQLAILEEAWNAAAETPHEPVPQRAVSLLNWRLDTADRDDPTGSIAWF